MGTARQKSLADMAFALNGRILAVVQYSKYLEDSVVVVVVVYICISACA